MRSGQGTANDLLYHFCVPVSRFRHQKAARRRLCVVLAGWRYAYPTYYFIGFCRPGKAGRHPNSASPVPEGLFRKFICGFAFQHRPDNHRTQQVEDSQYREQWAETNRIRQRADHQRKQGTCGPAAIPVRPLAVATSLRPNTSDESVISAPDRDW